MVPQSHRHLDDMNNILSPQAGIGKTIVAAERDQSP
jgi:hypothetical protein